MSLPPVLRTLLTTHGPSGYEAAPARAWRDAAAGFATVDVDTMGTSTATVAGTGGGLSVAVVGHIDEIGLILTHIDEKGYLYFAGVGGWDPQILVGQRVVIAARDGAVPGVIGKKPIHLLKDEERKKVAEIKDLHIDVGAADAEEAGALVRVGDVAVLDGEPVELPNGRAASRSMDYPLGADVAYEAARLVAEAGGAAGDVIGVAAVQEEIGLYGARASAYRLHPDVAIVVDVTHATDAPGIDVKEAGKHELGSGPVLERGSTLHPVLFDRLRDVAEADGIGFTVAASAGRTGTDADAIHFTRGGIPTACVSIPLRYMHSPVEMVKVSDVLDPAKLIAAFCRRLEPDATMAR
jgi:endoglucanase